MRARLVQWLEPKILRDTALHGKSGIRMEAQSNCLATGTIMAESTLKKKLALQYGPQGAAPAHLALAEGLEKIGRHAEAIASYEAAIRSDGTSLSARFGLARALLALGRAAEAFQSADQALL